MSDNTPDPFSIEDAPAPKTKLDRSRAFGTVHGNAQTQYFQDGKYFDYLGNPIEEG